MIIGLFTVRLEVVSGTQNQYLYTSYIYQLASDPSHL